MCPCSFIGSKKRRIVFFDIPVEKKGWFKYNR